jgi:hypothetical protein
MGVTAGLFFLTQGHFIQLAGVELTPIRFLEMGGFARVVIRGELARCGLNRLDGTVLLAYNYTAAIWLLRSAEATFRPISFAVDATLLYLTFRALVGSLEDLAWFLRAFAVLLIPFTALVLVERLTGESPFTIVGATGDLMFRSGVPRCQGSFRHAILLGSVAAAFLSLYAGLFLGTRHRTVASLGCVLCLALVVLSNSGGPLTSAFAAAVGWSAWVAQRQMARVRIAMVGIVIVLLFVMKDPIWYLPFKISQIVGGTGYHRSLLMDQAWQNLSKWWLAGIPIEDTAPWIPAVMFFGGADVTNQYLIFGIHAGLLALVLFISVLVVAFKRLGRTLASVREAADPDTKAGACLLWGLGVTLFVHTVSWLGISYFDQTSAVWLMHLALLSACVQSLEPRFAAALGPHRPLPRPSVRRVARNRIVPGSQPRTPRLGQRGPSRRYAPFV